MWSLFCQQKISSEIYMLSCYHSFCIEKTGNRLNMVLMTNQHDTRWKWRKIKTSRVFSSFYAIFLTRNSGWAIFFVLFCYFFSSSSFSHLILYGERVACFHSLSEWGIHMNHHCVQTKWKLPFKTVLFKILMRLKMGKPHTKHTISTLILVRPLVQTDVCQLVCLF